MIQIKGTMMRIIKLVLKGYKRLFLSHINKVEFTPENKVNLILGTNGGGKSSLMKELSPLPADLTREFDEDGYKDMTIEHNGKIYRLTSGLIAKNKHSFEVDNEELNPAGTKKVQLLLVKEHFNLTPEIHNVMLGLKGFTTMSVMERKNWLTNISTVDYTYALSIFNKLKQRHRDIDGAIKISQAELTKTNSVILDTKEQESINNEIDILKKSINELLSSKGNIKSNADIDIISIKSIIDECNSILTIFKKPVIKDNKSVEERIIELRSNIDKDMLKRKEIELILKDLSFIEDTKVNSSIEENNSKINLIKDKLSKLKDSVYIDLDLEKITEFKSMFIYIHGKLTDILNDIVLNTIDDYTITEYKKDMQNISNMNTRITDLNRQISKLESDKLSMEHTRDHNSVECNKCGNIWSVGFVEKEYRYVINKIAEFNKTIDSLNIEISDISNRTDVFSKKIENVAQIREMFVDNNLELLKPMFQYINANGDILNNANKALDILHKINNDLEYWSTYNSLIIQLDNLLKDASIIEEKRKIELKHFNSNKNKVEDDLFNIIELISDSKYELDNLEKHKTLKDKLIKYNNLLISFLRDSNYNLKNDINRLRIEAINEAISTLNLEVSKLEHKLNESKYNERLIDNNKSKIIDLTKKREAVKILLDGMSPTNGLIGKSITNFLNVFTADMNEIINSIWNYNMEILPCRITEDNDLDYKFEVRIDNRMPSKDVSETSSSQQEIIDLAFKIVSMKYLGMDNSYLLLDEFGRTFDTTHSKNAYDIIDILSNSSFSNVFIISHFENTYSRFKNADISVLNNDNLILNKELEINKVMKIS